jgi:hypothetical protein
MPEKVMTQESEEQEQDNHATTGDAMLNLINHLFNPTDEKLPELTDIPLDAVLPMSIMMMKEVALDPDRIKLNIRLSKIWRIAYLRLRRGATKRLLLIGADLAREQAANSEEKEGEAWEA